MDMSSGDDSCISDSDIDDYVEKPLDLLRNGRYKVKANGTLRCPFCTGKKKQDYKYKDLLQHASGVGKGYANKAVKRANHIALARYLETDLASESDQNQLLVAPEPVQVTSEEDELYVWPWMGVIVNPVSHTEDAGSLLDRSYWLKKFARYNPEDVHTFSNEDELTINVVIKFSSDWNGFINATEFEKTFQTERRGRKDWMDREENTKLNAYGWCARADDYNGGGSVGRHLQQEGRLKTIAGIADEGNRDRNRVMETLSFRMDMTSEKLDKLRYRKNANTMVIDRMLAENDKLQVVFDQERKNLQRIESENIRRILDEREKLHNDLEIKKQKLLNLRRALNVKETLTESERQRLDAEKEKNSELSTSLNLASMEHERADENVLRLLEEHKREKEKSLKEILHLETQLEHRQKLEREREELKGKIQVMKLLGNENKDESADEEKLKEIDDDLEDMESLKQTLLVQESQRKAELQDTRKELIAGIIDIPLNSNYIGVKDMITNEETITEEVKELWNFVEEREATLKEVVAYMFNEFKSLNKRKRARR